jgi:hypothetical protein
MEQDVAVQAVPATAAVAVQAGADKVCVGMIWSHGLWSQTTAVSMY